MRIILQEELDNVTGSKARELVGNLVYNKRSKEYMVLAEVPNYDNGVQKVIVVFSHGVKIATLNQVKEGTVPSSHNDKKINWLNEKDALPYLHYQDEMDKFFATEEEQKPSDAVSNKLEVLILAAKAIDAKVWEYEYEGQIFHIIAKNASSARRNLIKQMRKITVQEV